MIRCLIIDAGFFSSVIAERIANVVQENGFMIEKRNHIGSNSCDEKDKISINESVYCNSLF